MKFILTFLVFGFTLLGFAQDESEGPLMTNPQLHNKVANVELFGKSTNPIDSTFFYITDVLTLPFFDDFSTNKFQVYNAQPNDPNVTEEEHFAILENGQPTPASETYSIQQTYKRVVDVANGTSTDENFDTIFLDYSSLEVYPIERETGPYFPGYILIDTIDFPNPVDTIFLTEDIIQQDSATIFVVQIDNQDQLWLDSRAYHNYHLAKDPWTLGVASFDGLNENGYPYSFGAGMSQTADVLTAKPVDLSGNVPGDSVYLSFLVQPEGFGDVPEDGDSLTCEIYNPTTDEWQWAWSLNGSPTTDFQVGHIAIDNPELFANNFQFRFKNHGSIAGSLDHFHLDFVNLRANSAFDDTLFAEFALVYPPNTLLNEFSRVPWDHYKNSTDNKMSDSWEVVVRNGYDIQKNNPDGEVEISHGGTAEGTFSLVGQTLSGGDINYAPFSTYFSLHDLSGGYQFDKTKPGNKQIFDVKTGVAIPVQDLSINDTAFTTQEFYNYYAYDDGTAERAYGPTGNQARLAIQYTPYEAGSVIGAYMHFVPSVNDVSNDLFVLTIWEDNNGKPGDVIYQDDLFEPRTPFYEIEHNKFFPYYFKDYQKVPVSGTFYIGWRQFDARRLNIGLDKNIDNSQHTYFSVDQEASWIQSSIPGSVMIRPIFSTAMDVELGIDFQEPELISLYPNPASDMVTLQGANADNAKWQIIDLTGKILNKGIGKEVNVSELNTGIYLVQIEGQAKALRLVKK